MTDTSQTAFLNAAREARTDIVHHTLSHTLAPMLKSIFDRTNHSPITSFEDSINDFLLFLYHGPEYMRKACMPPFSILAKIGKESSVFSWIASAYRIRLLQMNGMPFPAGKVEYTEVQADGETPADCSYDLCHAIALCVQSCNPTGRFIILRWLLTVLEPGNAIPQSPMAEASGLSPVNYRVMTKRRKEQLSAILQQCRSGTHMSLDKRFRQMELDLNANLDNLYGTLLRYYDDCISELDGSAQIRKLIGELSQEAGHQLHST